AHVALPIRLAKAPAWCPTVWWTSATWPVAPAVADERRANREQGRRGTHSQAKQRRMAFVGRATRRDVGFAQAADQADGVAAVARTPTPKIGQDNQGTVKYKARKIALQVGFHQPATG
ncbi:MAG TPA: hypothetical protein VFY22_09650, partial [Hydrogenophaga sp.]|nr:hypothetical protein [Hydrogenophaga sp.]